MIFAIIVFVSLVNGVQLDQCETKLLDLNGRPIDPKVVCELASKPCIVKCCVQGEAIHYSQKYGFRCLPLAQIKNIITDFEYENETSENYSQLEIITDDGNISSSDIFDLFNVVHGNGYMEEECGAYIGPQDVQLFESGVARMQLDADVDIMPTQFCVDLMVYKSKGLATITYYYFYKYDQPEKGGMLFIIYGNVFSSVFLVLTLLVHWLLKPLRKTLYSWLLIANIASLTVLQMYNVGYLIYGLVQLANDQDVNSPEISEVVIPIQYFLSLSMIFWLNTLSIELWWTFRSIVVVRHKSNLSVRRKFLWFSLYACGSPAVLTLAALTADRWDAVDQRYKPHFDTSENDERRVNYFFYPQLLLVSSNCLLFLMTIYNIWLSSIRRKDRDSGGAVRKENNEKFKVFIKLFLIMGVGWVINLVQQKIVDEVPIWGTVLFNIYYCAFGLIIFIIFVCKRKVIGLLFIRFNIHNKFTERFTMQASTRTAGSKASKTYSGGTGFKSTDDSEIRNTTIRNELSEPHETLTHIRSEPHDTAAHVRSEPSEPHGRNTPSQYSLNITASALDKNYLHSLNNKVKTSFNDKNYKRNTPKFDEGILETDM